MFTAPLRLHSPPAPLRHPGAERSNYTTVAVLARRKEEKKNFQTADCGKEKEKKEKEGKLARAMNKLRGGRKEDEERGRA
jgi:hypothetical protein